MADKKQKTYVCQDLINKRKELWNKNQDIQQDKELVEAIVDKILSDDKLMKEVKNKPQLLIECTFTVVDKERNTVPFFLNEVQEDFVEKLEQKIQEKDFRPIFILKGRQQGFTTIITAIQLCYAIVRKNFAGYTVANNDPNTRAIFNDKAKFMYNRLPEALKPHEQFSNAKEMVFDKLNSTWRIECASPNMARSRTLNFVHLSEVAFFETPLGDIEASLGQTLTKDAIRVYETTANGYNAAKTLWDSKSCQNFFYEWWRTKEYRENFPLRLTDEQWLDEENYIDELNDEWLKLRCKWLKEEKELDDNQIAFYIKKYFEFKATENGELIKQEYPCTPEESFIASGECVFDADVISKQIDLCRNLPPIKKGYFKYKREIDTNGYIKISEVEFFETQNGYITIYEEPIEEEEMLKVYGDVLMPTGLVMKNPYTIGGDTAGEGSDFFAGIVMNNRTKKVSAVLWKQKLDEDLYAEQIACLGYYYHNALIGVEVNFSILPQRILEKQLLYPNLYRRTQIDSITGQTENKCGFLTNKKTRPVILGDLIKFMREDPTRVKDIEILKEMLSFVRVRKNTDTIKMEAQAGCHDDLVMSLAITLWCCNEQGSTEWIVEEKADRIKAVFDELDFGDEEEIGGMGAFWLP